MIVLVHKSRIGMVHERGWEEMLIQQTNTRVHSTSQCCVWFYVI